MSASHNHIYLLQSTTNTETIELPLLKRPLSDVERRDFIRLEAGVRRDLRAFIRAGMALLEIKRRKLYREKFHTFDDYCHAVWGWKRSQAYRMLDAADICAKMFHLGDVPLPTNERQVRPLRGLSGEKATKAWKLAVSKAKGKEPTGALVQASVSEVSQGYVPKAEKLTWQMNIEPLMKQGLEFVRSGDRDQFELIIEKISCLLLVGKRPSTPTGTAHSEP